MNFWKRVVYEPRKVAAREWLFQVHLWVGLVVGLYAVGIGVSGSVLMFRQELQLAEFAGARKVEAAREYASVDAWMEAIGKAAKPARGVVNLQWPEGREDAVRATIFRRTGPQHFFVNPYSGALLMEKTEQPGVMRWLEHFHHNLFLERVGRWWNGIGALCLLVLAVTGMLLWWPGAGKWTRRLWVDGRASWKRINFDLHHAVGFWGLGGFALLCVTGAFFTWPQAYRGAVGAVMQVTPPPGPPRVEGSGERRKLSELVAIAEREGSGRRVVRAAIPLDGAQPARLNFAGPGRPFYRTATTVVVNPFSGEVLRVERFENKTAGDRLLGWIGPLHFGNFGGWPVQWLWFVLGLTMPLLFVTGFVMWWLRVVRKRVVATAEADYYSEQSAGSAAG